MEVEEEEISISASRVQEAVQHRVVGLYSSLAQGQAFLQS